MEEGRAAGSAIEIEPEQGKERLWGGGGVRRASEPLRIREAE